MSERAHGNTVRYVTLNCATVFDMKKNLDVKYVITSDSVHDYGIRAGRRWKPSSQ